MSTVNSKATIDAINAQAHAKTPRGKQAAKLAEINHQLDQIKGEMLSVTRLLSQLQAAVRVNANTPAKETYKRPFKDRSPAHAALWERVHGKKAPAK